MLLSIGANLVQLLILRRQEDTLVHFHSEIFQETVCLSRLLSQLLDWAFLIILLCFAWYGHRETFLLQMPTLLALALLLLLLLSRAHQ